MTRRDAAVFGLYVLLAASLWMLQLLVSSNLLEFERRGYAAAIAVAGSAVWELRRGRLERPNRRLMVCGLLLFFVPTVLLTMVGVGVPAFTRVAILGLVAPVVLLMRSGGGDAGSEFLGPLGGAVAGVGGLFLMLPADPALLFARPVAGLSLLAAVVCLGVGSSLAPEAMAALRFESSVVWLLGPSVLLSFAVRALEGVPLESAGLRDVPGVLWGSAEVLLLITSLRRLAPVAFSARYLLVPLLTTVEGMALLRPRLEWRSVTGVALVVTGAVMLLRRRGEGEDSRLSLR